MSQLSTYGRTTLWSCDRDGCPQVASAPLGFLPAGWVTLGERHWCDRCASGDYVPPPRPIPVSPASPFATAYHVQRERRKRLMVTRALWTLAAACAVAACAIVARGCS